MENQPQVIEENQHEVDVPILQKGEVKMFNKSGFTNPAPDKLKRVLTAIRYTLVGGITMIAGTDLFSGYQSKVICFILGVCILVCGGIELGVGVKPLPEEKI